MRREARGRPPPGAPRGRWRVVVVAASLAVSGLLVVNWLVPGLRLTSVRWNRVVLLVAFLLPVPALVLAMRHTGGATRLAVGLLLVPVAATGLALAVVTVATCPTCFGKDFDPAFVPVRQVTCFGHQLAAYRVRGGMPDPPAILVREQTPVLPGLDWVRRIGGLDDATTVDIEPLGRGLVRLSYPPVPGHREAVVDSVVRIAPP